MPRPATSSKIKKFIDETITSQFGNWLALLTDGDLRTFESELFDSVMATYNFVCEALLPIASCHAADELVEQGKASGGRKIELRRLSLRIATGHQVEVESPYVKQPGKSWKGSRHLLVDHWNIIGGTSPGLYDKVGFCSALGPSYDIAQQTLMKFGVEICLSSVRDLTKGLADL